MSAKPWKLADPGDLRKLDLRVHALLADVPLHDVWQLDLPGGPAEATVDDVSRYMSLERLAELNWVVRALFAVRGWTGRVFGWDSDDESPPPGPDSYVHRLTPEDRAASTAEVGNFDGPFRVVFGDAVELVGEIRNSTVHAFSVQTLQRTPDGWRYYWAIYVKPVGRITGFYMALIDPFRRFLVYPAMLRHVHRSWTADHSEAD